METAHTSVKILCTTRTAEWAEFSIPGSTSCWWGDLVWFNNMSKHASELRNLLEQKKEEKKKGHQNPKRDSVLLSRSSNVYLSRRRNCSAIRLIMLLVIVLWVRLRSSRVFEVRTFGVARSLSTQIKLVSDHLQVSIRNCSRCLEALQKVREVRVRTFSTVFASEPNFEWRKQLNTIFNSILFV